MALHNNTEQDFRDKLNQREITPSANAWDRLDAMLTVAEEKKSRRGYGWLYIAATILGFLLIGTVFLSQTEPMVDAARDNVVFENPAVNPAEASNEVLVPSTDSQTIAATASPIIKKQQNNHQSKSIQSIITRANGGHAMGNQNPVEAVAQNQDHQELIASANPILSQKKEQSVSVKVDELLAAVQSEQVKPKTSVKVNAKSLLSEVDRDVKYSFRGKMLRRAGEVADAVVNRNNER